MSEKQPSSQDVNDAIRRAQVACAARIERLASSAATTEQVEQLARAAAALAQSRPG